MGLASCLCLEGRFSTSGELQKVGKVMNLSQQWLLFCICRDPGQGRTTIKTLKKERAIESKWEQFVSAKVSLILIYSFLLFYYFHIDFTLYGQQYVDTAVCIFLCALKL